MKNLIKTSVLLFAIITVLSIGCSKQSVNHELTKKISYGGFKAPSMEAVRDSFLKYSINHVVLSKTELDTQYAYHDYPYEDSLYYVVILPMSMAPDSLAGKEFATSGGNMGSQFGPVPDCRGNTIITIEEVLWINNPQYQYLLDMLNNNELVILPYCYPF